jgi:hypothetical protein
MGDRFPLVIVNPAVGLLDTKLSTAGGGLLLQ